MPGPHRQQETPGKGVVAARDHRWRRVDTPESCRPETAKPSAPAPILTAAIAAHMTRTHSREVFTRARPYNSVQCGAHFCVRVQKMDNEIFSSVP